MQELRLKIGKMTCTNCSNAIERVCKKIDGVSDASVSYVSSSGIFLLENAKLKDEISKKIKELGFEILEDENLELDEKKQLLKLKINLSLSIALSLVIMYFEMFVEGGFSKTMQMLLAFFAIFYCGRSFFFHAFAGLKYKNLDMNTLVSLGALSSFVYSMLVYFNLFSKDEHLYFGGGAMIISFVLLGKFLEERIKFKALKYQKKLEKINTKKVKILDEAGNIKESSSAFVKAGDILLLSEGEFVSVDGVILEGRAELDLSFLNGEFLPILKQAGDEILAGSFVISGTLKIKANKKAMDSTLEQLKDLVFKAGSIKTPLANLANQISAYFVGIIIILASFVFVFWSVKEDFNIAFLHSCALLLISCPCALGLATPIVLTRAFENAAKNFILIKNPATLENLDQIKCVIFDKTGTLTQNHLSVFKHNLTKEDFKKLGFIESFSSHPIAKAIFKASNLEKNSVKASIETLVGKGLIYKEEEHTFLAGNEEFLKEYGVDFKRAKEFLTQFEDEAPVQVYFAKDKECLGAVALSNALKNGAKELIEDLRKQGIKSVILSGDNLKSVRKTALELGIDEFYAGLKPEEKLEFIKTKEKEQRILFVGDGINDAAAMNLASASISFAKASELAKKTGDFILMKEDLNGVFLCFKLSKKSKTLIKLNLFWAFIYNICCIPIAAGILPFITLSPHIAALAMCFSSLAVVLNSLRKI